eukprot:21461_1
MSLRIWSEIGVCICEIEEVFVIACMIESTPRACLPVFSKPQSFQSTNNRNLSDKVQPPKPHAVVLILPPHPTSLGLSQNGDSVCHIVYSMFAWLYHSASFSPEKNKPSFNKSAQASDNQRRENPSGRGVYSRPIAAQYCISQKGNDERHAYQKSSSSIGGRQKRCWERQQRCRERERCRERRKWYLQADRFCARCLRDQLS